MGKPAAMASLQCFILLGRRKKWYVVFWQPKNRALNDMTTKSEEKKKSSCQLKNTYIFFKTSLNMKFKNISTSSMMYNCTSFTYKGTIEGPLED